MTITNGDPDDLYNKLRWKLNETEPCRKAYNNSDRFNDVEQWTGAWVNSTTPEVAAELCADCHVLDLCGEYATIAEENSSIWGGMTPEQRKEKRRELRRLGTKKTHARPAEDAEGTR
jgi:hypothetical protein